MIEATELVLKNNNFILSEETSNQEKDTVMDTNFALPWANPSAEFLVETILLPAEIWKHFFHHKL